MQMMMVQQLGYTQSHLLRLMGLFVPQGTVQKPVLAHYPASPSKRTHAVSKTQQELPTTSIQLSSYPSQLPSHSVQGSYQDRTFYFVSQCVATLQGEVLHAKYLQELSRSHCLTQSQETD